MLAVVLWFVVDGDAADGGARAACGVAPTLDSSLVLRDAAADLHALVAGRAADLVKLDADPPVVRRIVGGDAPDTLVLDLRRTTCMLPPELVDACRARRAAAERHAALRVDASRSACRSSIGGRVVVRTDSGATGARPRRVRSAERARHRPAALVRGMQVEIQPHCADDRRSPTRCRTSSTSTRRGSACVWSRRR